MESTAARLLSADEVAERLNLPPSWVREAARQKRIPSLKFGRWVRFDEDEITEWAKRQKRGGVA